MAKFKRERKEMTTEPSVEPRMKKGMPAAIQRTGAMGMPRAARPNVAPPLMAAAAMKEGGKADMMQDKAMMKKAFKQHDMQEHKGDKGTTLKLKHGGMHKATGGVANMQGGYKDGGMPMGLDGKPTFVGDGKGKMKKGGKAMMGGGMMKKGGKAMMGGGMMMGGYKTGGTITPSKYKEGGHVEMKCDSLGHTVMKKKYGGSC